MCSCCRDGLGGSGSCGQTPNSLHLLLTNCAMAFMIRVIINLSRKILITYFLCISIRGNLITYIRKNLKQLIMISLLGKTNLVI